MSVPLRADDPAYWMLQRGREDPSWRSTRHVPIHQDCYICVDPEFELMGLPLCYKCPFCEDGGHVPADDTVCTHCEQDVMEELMRRSELQQSQEVIDGTVIESLESGPV